MPFTFYPDSQRQACIAKACTGRLVQNRDANRKICMPMMTTGSPTPPPLASPVAAPAAIFSCTPGGLPSGGENISLN